MKKEKQFNHGDRVLIRGKSIYDREVNGRKGTVKKNSFTMAGYIRVKLDESTIEGVNFVLVEPKQLRRLKKKEKREPVEFAIKKSTYTVYDIKMPEFLMTPKEFWHVREVLE